MNKSEPIIKEYLIIAAGSIIFAAANNLFIVPSGVYAGGIVGTAQIIRTVLNDYLNISFSFDIAGIINMCLNVPLLVMAYFILNSSFVKKTVFSVAIQTVAFSAIPVYPVVSDNLAAIIIGSIVAGYGVGLILIQKATAGGNDVTSMLLMKHNPNLSVGKFNLLYNVFVYIFCAILFNLETSIYSILHATLFSVVVDRLHLQNIEVSLMIFTRNDNIKNMIINDMHRGVTYWKGQGAYTNNETEVLVTIVSKYEVPKIRREILKMDPKAFIIVSSQLNVDGNVEKRLI
ncbi:MAG: YitT family protein [Firmicutes bacterium]|nr:YitT family protein [Bacillota bacterium]MDY3091531.1 YitT family protein [Erysipelotrichaceae bacterium]